MRRLPVGTFNLPVDKIRNGYYSAAYFNRTKRVVAEESNLDKTVTMQVFQRNHATVCGVDEAIAILKVGAGERVKSTVPGYWGWADRYKDLEVLALRDGDKVEPWEPVLVIKGSYKHFAHLESLYLGALARGTRVATNTARCVEAAAGKPVLFFADRFDYFGTQERDGYAAHIGGASMVATGAHGAWFNENGSGTMPHALIACAGGSVVDAARGFVKHYPDIPLIGLVDFNNDCVGDSLELLKRFGRKLEGVRLDTSGNMVDFTLASKLVDGDRDVGNFDPRGVNAQLVRLVRANLDIRGGAHVKIYVSGGFTPEKIATFTSEGVPVDGFGVGSSLLRGEFDYTADIVAPTAKVGRRRRDHSRLTIV